jgi:hypothetical protein
MLSPPRPEPSTSPRRTQKEEHRTDQPSDLEEAQEDLFLPYLDEQIKKLSDLTTKSDDFSVNLQIQKVKEQVQREEECLKQKLTIWTNKVREEEISL